MSETLKDKKVLLVDDDSDILTSMQAAFEPTGAEIETASNGNKAVELAEKNQPDLVVLDMMLPGRSGFLVLEKIKAVTAAQVQEVARKYFGDDQLTVATLVPLPLAAKKPIEAPKGLRH